jgi:hypothetical protein
MQTKVNSKQLKPLRTLFSLKLSAAEREWLGQLADQDGVSCADVLRMLIRRAYRPAVGG